MPLEVIGAGFGRTGTLSLRSALIQLGFDPCYHMFENVQNEDSALWLDIERAVRQCDGGSSAHRTGASAGSSASVPAPENATPSGILDKLRTVFDRGTHGKQYKATVDFPASVYYKELMQVYPDAKVVLSVRDSGAKWYESTRDTIASNAHWVQLWTWSFYKRAARHMRAMTWACIWGNPRVFNGRFTDRATGIDVYNRWIAEVKENVPADKLLVFNVKEGWQPLCDFLGVPVPDTPFPHSNETEDFKKMVAKTNWALAGVVASTLAVLTAGGALAVRASHQRTSHGSGGRA